MATAEAESPVETEAPEDQPADVAADPAAEQSTEQPTEPVSEYTRLEQRHYQSILDRQRDVHSKRIDYLASKEETKSLKGVFEAALSELQLLIEKGPDKQLPLPGMETAAAAAPPKPDESWRKATLDELGLTGAIAKALAENEPPLTTLGAISDWTKEYRLIDVKGIGEAKADDIEEALEDYWRRNPQQPENAAEAVAEPGPLDDAPDDEDEPEDDGDEE